MPGKIAKISVFAIIINLCLTPVISPQTTTWLSPEYIGSIQQRINSYFVYPQEAQLNGWEGIVKVKFTLTAGGQIKEIDIAESSGYPLLDAAAILAIKDASPYPFPKNAARSDELEITVPIRYEQVKLPYQTLESQQQTAPLLAGQKTVTISEEKKSRLSAVQETGAPSLGDLSKKYPLRGLSPSEESVLSQQKSSPELLYFLHLALQNNQPTKVARQEVELAHLKVMESMRNFLPAVKLQAYNTTGTAYQLDYEEREAKIELNQPLYYGGRLTDTMQQAQVNLEITEKNYDRLKFDVMQKAEVAYYNLIAAKMHLREKEILLSEAEELLEKIQKLAVMGLVIQLEADSASSWFEQIRLQMDAIKQDLYMAELTFRQVLNVKETPKIDAQLIEAKRSGLNLILDNCLEIAFKNRPEMHLSQLLVKFNDFGQRIESTKNNAFTVDLTTSYGLYEGAYKTEEMQHSDNWYIGFKATKPFGPSTANAAYTQEHVEPRFGQTSPTESSTISGELSLVDNLKRLSDKKRSDIDLQRSISDFDETLKTITFEVQDAFLNYQKALLQLNTAEVDMKFRRSQTEITKIRSMVGEASLSSAMEALYSLSEAQSKYLQSFASYQISLVNLKKATGYGLKI